MTDIAEAGEADARTELTAEEVAAAEKKAAEDFERGFKRVQGTGDKAEADAKAPAEAEARQATEEAEAKAKADSEAEAKAKAEADAKTAEEAAYAALPKALRERVERIDSIAGSVDKLAGHVGGFKRTLDQMVATANAAAKNKGADAPSAAQVEAAKADATGAAWKQMQEDYPDWTAALDERLAGLQPKAVDVDGIKKQVTEGMDARIGQAVDMAEERALVRLKHPNWKQTVKTPEFSDWFKGQPEDVRQKAQSDLADDAIAVFDAFAAHQKAITDAETERQRKEKRLKSAVTPTGTPAPRTTGLSDEEAFERGFKKTLGGPTR